MDLFKDILTSINTKDRYLMNEPDNEKFYVPFVVNKALSYDIDSILFVNEMNKCHILSPKMQYDFYFFGLPKKKRFGKWIKAEETPDVKCIMEYYKCNESHAKEYINILDQTQIKEIKKRLGYDENE